jgi:hypothetical protein
MTCVMFDKRGIGLSDRFDGVPTISTLEMSAGTIRHGGPLPHC